MGGYLLRKDKWTLRFIKQGEAEHGRASSRFPNIKGGATGGKAVAQAE